MSTDNEQDLEINQFRGVNRYSEGTVTPENEFQTIQNMYLPSEGELRGLGGVRAETQTMQGDPTRLFYLNQDWHASNYDPTLTITSGRGLVAFYRPPWFAGATAFPSAPTGVTFSTSGGTPTTHKVRVVFVLSGGQETYFEYTGVSFEVNGATATLPTNVPAICFCVNYYVETISGPGAGSYIWAGTLSRLKGSFPANIVLPKPDTTGLDALYALTPDSIRCTNTGVGNLQGGKTYYFGIAPWIATGANQVRLQGSTNNLLAYTLPADKSSITLEFQGLATTSSGIPITRVVIYMGITPTDMLPVWVEGSAGKAVPTLRTTALSGIVIDDLPLNSNMAPHTDEITLDTGTLAYEYSFEEPAYVAGALPQLSAIYARQAVAFETSNTQTNFNGLGAYFLPDARVSDGPGDAERIELLPNLDMKTITVKSQDNLILVGGAEPTPDRFTFYADGYSQPYEPGNYPTTAYGINSTQFGNFLFFTDGYSIPYTTNGIVIKPAFRANAKAPMPIVGNCIAYQNRLILGGGAQNYYYTPGIVYYSEPDQPNNFGTAGNQISAISEETSAILGFAIYGQNLITSGLNTFLVIGKETSAFLWNGRTGTDELVQQLERSVGFASTSCVAQTKYGPIYVGYDNVYLVGSQTDVVPIGFEIQDIILSMTSAQKKRMKAVWHEDHLKIAYPSDPGILSVVYDREIWCKMIQSGGNLKRYWTGPHDITDANYQDMVVAKIWEEGAEENRDLRFSTGTSSINLRDVEGLGTFLGQDIEHFVSITRLGLKADHFRKLLNRIYLAVKITQNENFIATIKTEDGTYDGATSFSMTIPATLVGSAFKKILQKWVTERIMSRITTLEIANTSDAPVSIYDISLLFKVLKRRKIT